jgi:hypothetical protein
LRGCESGASDRERNQEPTDPGWHEHLHPFMRKRTSPRVRVAASALSQVEPELAFYKQLLEVASASDTDRPELQRARAFVKQR